MNITRNQNPEQKARDNIDKMLAKAGWVVRAGLYVLLSSLLCMLQQPIMDSAV